MKPQLNDIQKLCEFVLGEAKKQGAEACNVSAAEAVGNSVGWRQGKVEELTRERDVNVSFTVYKDQRKGSVSLSDTSDEALKAGIQAALTSAQFTEGDKYAGPAEPHFLAQVDEKAVAALELWHDDLPDVSTLTELARRAEEAAYAADKRIVNSDGGAAYTQQGRLWQASSNGFSEGVAGTRCGVNVSVLARAGDSQQSNYAYDSARGSADLQTPEEIGQKAADKALAALNPRSVKTGSYPVLFSPEMAAGIIGHLLGALGGTTQYRKLGFLTGAQGQVILPEWLSLVEQPFLPRGASSALFDNEGVAVRTPTLVEKGRLQRYLLGSYSARRLGLEPTGNGDGVHNLQLQADASYIKPLPELYRSMDSGVLVTGLMGQGVNGLTGDYSRGASGFWIEHGEIQYPVEGITIAGNLKEMLKDITALGDDSDTHGRVHAPSLLLSKMTVAG